MTPMLPTLDESWSQIATRLTQEAILLEGSLPLATRRALLPLLRLVNCYYSNLIEGHRTLPAEVASAMRQARTGTKAQQQLVIEAMAHITVQEDLDLRLREPDFAPTALPTITWVHQRFIELLPPELHFTEPRRDGTRVQIMPGCLREVAVTIGLHEPPPPQALPEFMAAFDLAYRDHRRPTPETIARIAAAHQRFMWIHPFVDGNGRVGRLLSDAMFAGAGLDAGGLWRLSRGFARTSAYKTRLQEADHLGQGALDGRSNLSQHGLDRWCQFVVDVALDQIAFMRDLVHVEHLPRRIITWAKEHFPKQSALHIGLLLERVVRYGAVDRATAYALLGVTERHARRIIDRLVSEQLIALGDHGSLLPQFPLHVVPAWFPELFPACENPGLEQSLAEARRQDE